MAMHDVIDITTTKNARAESASTAELQNFCRAVSAIIDNFPVEEVPRRVAALLPDLLAVPRLLTDSHRAAPADGYGRNRVFICPADRFSVLAMIWPAGVSTPVHDHRDWCALGVYEGEIEETHFDATGDDIAVPRTVLHHRMGAVSHLPVNAPNIHRIHNPTDEVAISIHVYGGNCEKNGPNLDKVYALDA